MDGEKWMDVFCMQREAGKEGVRCGRELGRRERRQWGGVGVGTDSKCY